MLVLWYMLVSLLFILGFSGFWSSSVMILFMLCFYSLFMVYSPFGSAVYHGAALMADGLSMPLVILTLWIAPLMVLASQKILFNSNKVKKFISLVMVLTIILVLSFSVDSFVLYYILFEASLIPTLLLVLGWGYQPERLQAGMYLMLYTITASLPLLVNLVYTYNINFSSSMSFSVFYLGVGGGLTSLWWFIFVMAFMVKMPLFSVHLWLPKAHVEAPVAGSMVLAAVLLKLGSYGLVRVSSMFVWVNMSLSSFMSCLSLWGACVTGMICVRQTDMKSLIAYSSVGHMGLLVAGCMSCTLWGWQGSLVLMVAHGLCSSGLFAMANMTYESVQTRSLYLIGGLMNLFPAMTMFWFILSAVNMAAPPSINLLGEIMLITGSMSLSVFLGVFIGLMCFLAGAYSLVLYTSTQHGAPLCASQGLSMISARNFVVCVLHVVPIFALIASGEIIGSWV